MLGRGKSTNPESGIPSRGVFYIPRMTTEEGIFADGRSDYIFTDFLKEVELRIGKPFPAKALSAPDSTINELISNHGLVAVMIDQGKKYCYSYQYWNKLPQPFIDRVQSIGVQPADTVLWSNDVFKEPQEGSAREVIYGQKPQKPPKRQTRAQVKKKWAEPQELTPEEMRFLMGQKDDPKG